jgi:hypothetical protein
VLSCLADVGAFFVEGLPEVGEVILYFGGCASECLTVLCQFVSDVERNSGERYNSDAKTRPAVAIVKAKEAKPIIVDARLIGASADCVETATPISVTQVEEIT